MEKDVLMMLYIAKLASNEKAFILELNGKTYSHKEEIKAMGFTWDGFTRTWEKLIMYSSKEKMKTELEKCLNSGFIIIDRGSYLKTCKELFGE